MIANPTAEELKFKTKADGYVNVHPSSVNAKVAVYEVGSVPLRANSSTDLWRCK